MARITNMSKNFSPAENLTQRDKIFLATLSPQRVGVGQPEKCRAKLNGPYYTVKTIKVPTYTVTI
jgi:hypothetical protein